MRVFLLVPLLCFFLVHSSLGQRVLIPVSGIVEEGISFENQLRVTEDESKEWSLEQVLNLPASEFVSAESYVPKSNRSISWVKTAVQNQSQSSEFVLSFNHLSHVTVYVIKDGKLLEEAYGGEYSREQDRRLKDGRLYVQLNIPASSGVELYIKIRQRKNFAPILNFELVNRELFFSKLQNRAFKEALVFGSFGILFIYGLILFFGNKHRPYLWLSLLVILKAVFFSQMIGYFTDLVTPNNPKFAWDILVLLMYGSGIASLLLVRDFLYLKKDHKLFNKILNGFIIFLAIQAMVIYFIKYYHENYLLGNLIGFASYIPQGLFLTYMFIKLLPKIPVYKRAVVIGIVLFVVMTLFTSVNFVLNLEKSYGQYTWNEVIGTLAFILLYFYTLGLEMQLNEKEKNVALKRINDITQNQKAELEKTVKERTQELEVQYDKLQERNDQVEVLLKEIHHRVKNNLQVISSLLEMQSYEIDDEQALSTFMEGQNRVRAMALIHQKLYQNDNMSTIDFASYASELMKELSSLYASKGVSTQVEVKETYFDIDTAVPLGLILNELISNAYKYAFEGANEGALKVSLKSVDEKRHVLTVEDNGVGLPEQFDVSKAKSLGLRLVNRLAEQLYGTVEYIGEKGALFVISFTENTPETAMEGRE